MKSLNGRFRVVARPTMRWHCIDCHKNFQGPTDRSPKDGCAHCGSKNVFDCNIEPLSPNQVEPWEKAIAEGKVRVIPVRNGRVES
jgi:DNA-directed RNA polymerase subunit RPC12/RpoP